MSGTRPAGIPRSGKTRWRLLEAANCLFYERGIRATCVGARAERAGVTEMTLAERLFVLLEGAYVIAALGGEEHILGRVCPLAQDLVAAAGAGTGSHG